MIENQWYAILDSKELKNNKPIGTIRMSGKVVENHIGCPFDGFKYDSSRQVNNELFRNLFNS